MVKLLSFEESINLRHDLSKNLYKKHVNKGLLFAFQILGLNYLDIKSASGSTIYLSNGDEILDLTSGIGVLALGHNHPRIKKIEQKCHDLNIIDSQKFGPNKLQAALAYNLSQLLPGDLEVSFFSVSGAEANESAIKLVTKAKGLKAKYFISTKNSYHGKTLGSLSLTNTENFSEGFHLGLPKENTIKIKYNNIDEYINIIKKLGKENIAAIIIEPIQGQNIEVAKENYLSKICAISKQNGIYVIFDEIKCGLGRSGEIFSFLNQNCIPDIITTSKALGGGKNAISAMVARTELFLKAYGPIKKSTIHTTTFFGLGEACATAIETLNIISEKSFLDDVKIKSNLLFNELNLLKKQYPKYIKEIKGKGMFVGIEFDFESIILLGVKRINIPFIHNVKTTLMGALIREYLINYKILLHFNNSKPEILVILPSLIISDKEILYFIESTKKILTKGFLKIFSKFIYSNLIKK